MQAQSIFDGSANVTHNQSYGYDGVNRLTSASEGSTWSQNYVYDMRGNRALLMSPASSDPSIGASLLLRAPTLSASSVPFDANNRWTAPGVSYADGRGNLTDVAMSPNSFHATYDGENRMTTATVTLGTSSTTVTYGYDGDGNRVSKVITGGASTSYVYDAQGNLAAEYSSATNPDIGTQYLTSDPLSSTRLITTGTTAPVVSSRSDYLPFGQEIPTNWNRANYQPDASETIKFTGQVRDAETALDYFGARYFSAAQGRFTSPDKALADQHPNDPQSWNLYTYVRNNPLGNSDPSGAECRVTGSFMTALSSCLVEPAKDAADIPIAAVKEAANLTIVPTSNALNAILDPLIAFTGVQFGQSEGFAPSNSNQADLMDFFGFSAMTLGMQGSLVSPSLPESGTVPQTFEKGSFSISDWTGYPASVPKPAAGTTFRLLEGEEYQAARTEANLANRTIRLKDPASYQNMELHEITPVKFGGSPTSLANKVALPTAVHRQLVTPWWNALLRDLLR